MAYLRAESESESESEPVRSQPHIASGHPRVAVTSAYKSCYRSMSPGTTESVQGRAGACRSVQEGEEEGEIWIKRCNLMPSVLCAHDIYQDAAPLTGIGTNRTEEAAVVDRAGKKGCQSALCPRVQTNVPTRDGFSG